MIDMTRPSPVSAELIARFAREAGKRPEQRALRNAVVKNGIQAVALDPQTVVASAYTFSLEIPTGPITHQQQSGRCWMFAGLNVLRVKAAQAMNLKEWEFSQAYPMFWDKMEKANYFLESILETLDEPRDSRVVAWLLANLMQDGGQWDMFVNLIEKYGAVPKSVMPETFHSSQSQVMNRLLNRKLRSDAARLRERHASGVGLSAVRAEKEAMLGDIYQMLTHFLGEPPAAFDWEYRDQDDHFHAERQLTPQAFYARYVGVDLSQYVSLINAPTADKPYGRTYTVQHLGNVIGGRPVRYLNVDAGTLRRLALAQLEDGEPVWFGCDVGQLSDRDSGVMAPELYDYEGVLGVSLDMSKAEQLDYGESLMTHAMVLTGVNLVKGQPNRWKVENSWGPDRGHQGFFVMSDQWFDRYLYQVVVHRKYLPPDLDAAWEREPLILPPWDPMGSLARVF
ncbi:MAG: C1 family peptidase [Thermaerobacter sp.]|nr:C1 family peptidase [Thermaerobacter sp.]